MVLPEITLDWQVATTEAFTPVSVVARGTVVATPFKNGMLRASATVTGLTPGERYFYRFMVLPDGPVSPVGSFFTPSLEAGAWRNAMLRSDHASCGG